MTSRRAIRLTDYFRAARRRKLILIVPALVLACATAVALRDLPELYESTVRIRIESTKSDSTPDPTIRLREIRESITSRDFLEPFIRATTKDGTSTEAGFAQLRGRISASPDTSPDASSDAFLISYRDTDPETARRIAAELGDSLVARAPTEPLAKSNVQELRKRAADISSQLRELGATDTWAATVPASEPPRTAQLSRESVRAQQMTIESLKDQQYKIQQQLADLETRLTAQRQIVEQQKRGSTLRDNPTYAVLIAKRTELQGQRDTLLNRQELTDKHPRVLAIADQIAAINRQIEELRQQETNHVSQTPEARELASLESDRNRLKIELEVTGRELGRRAANAPILATTAPLPERRSVAPSKLTNHYLELKKTYQDVTNELENAEARLSGDNRSTITGVTVLEPAQLPHPSVLPRRPVLISAAGIAGLVLGSMLAFFAEFRRFRSLQNARDVEYYTRLPLLAAIPITTTASERRRARWRSMGRFLFAAATTVALTVGLTRIFIAADLLELVVK